MSIALLILVLYYLRPQDWMPGMAGTNVIKPVVAIGLLATLSRPQGLKLSDVLRTPIDWFIIFYTAYVILTAPDIMETFKAFIPLPVFYFLTTLAIQKSSDLHRYLKWWVAMLAVLSALAVASLYGFDPTHGMEYTDAYKGRLSLGTYIHNNPNALGHTVVCAIPLLYLLFIWKNPVTKILLATSLIPLAAYAAYRTESKGAYLVGAGGLVVALILGQSKLVQILALTAALILGGSLLAMLPRMDTMGDLRSNEGVQGRLMAWEMARTASQTHTTGEGFKQFEAFIHWEGKVFQKATHGSYVRIGADLGYPGLFLYLGILWCCISALLQKTKLGDTSIERSRRMMFVLVSTYMASGWMIDRSYHTEFFLIAAIISAYSRIKEDEQEAKLFTNKSKNDYPISEAKPLPSISRTSIPLFGGRSSPTISYEQTESDQSSSARKISICHPPKLLDLVVALVMTWATLHLWDYILKNI